MREHLADVGLDLEEDAGYLWPLMVNMAPTGGWWAFSKAMVWLATKIFVPGAQGLQVAEMLTSFWPCRCS